MKRSHHYFLIILERSSKMHTEIIRPLKAFSVFFLDGMGFNINSKILFHNIRSVIETSGVSLIVVVVYWITRKCIRNIIFAFRYLATVDGVLCTFVYFCSSLLSISINPITLLLITEIFSNCVFWNSHRDVDNSIWRLNCAFEGLELNKHYNLFLSLSLLKANKRRNTHTHSKYYIPYKPRVPRGQLYLLKII